jgi:hypothetical protein
MLGARSFAIAFALSALIGCSSDPDGVSRKDCQRLRDHLIDIRMQSVTADAEQHRAALEAIAGESFITTCVDQTTEEQLHCALASRDGDALTHCAESTAP